MESLTSISALKYIESLSPKIVDILHRAIIQQKKKKKRSIPVKIYYLETICKNIKKDLLKEDNKLEVENIIAQCRKDYTLLINKLYNYDTSFFDSNKVNTYHGEDIKREITFINEHIVKHPQYTIDSLSGVDCLYDIYIYPHCDGNMEKCNKILSLSNSKYNKYIFDIQEVSIGSYISFETFYNAGQGHDISMIIYDNISLL